MAQTKIIPAWDLIRYGFGAGFLAFGIRPRAFGLFRLTLAPALVSIFCYGRFSPPLKEGLREDVALRTALVLGRKSVEGIRRELYSGPPLSSSLDPSFKGGKSGYQNLEKI